MRAMVGFDGFARQRKRWRLLCIFAVRLFLASLLAAGAQAADGPGAQGTTGAEDGETAQVTVDGHVILAVRGISGFPAERRAAEIRDRIITVAADEDFPSGAINLVEKGDRTDVLAGELLIIQVFDIDADMEGVDRKILAENVQFRLQEAITAYRHDRSPRVLLRNSLYALGVTLVAAGLFLGFRKGFRSLDGLVVQRLKDRLKALEAQSSRFIRAQQVAKILRGVFRAIYFLLVVLILYFYLNFVLGLYPWTRPFAAWLFDLILTPLRSMGASVLASVPDLVFLVTLYYITRYILRMIRAFFDNIDSGVIHLKSFEREWAWPTFRILRVLVVIFALVVAYPYIPGSDSEAFKGISILLGLIVSIGSSSIIANIIAGYSLTYRRLFKIGDRVKINDTIGDVMETRVLVTKLKSLKNEEVILPSTAILTGEVVNFSSLAEKQGLILHTTVGIGYETPWRQVEAMLRLAAERTSGLLRKPEPFVLQKALGDFAVTYEINAYCSDPKHMMQLYSALHRNILDVFNEYGVAIMTPAYEGDPEQPKLVPKDQWYAAPATPAPEKGAG
jgi:small-conductance mechanosensitive channel